MSKRAAFALLAGALASACLMVPAQSRDRPGTPNGGFAADCGSPLTEAPAICVEFRNTATEEVGFLMNWTQNGQLMPSDLRGRSDCRNRSAQHYYCHALKEWFLGDSHVNQLDHVSQLINPTSDRRFTTERDHPEGFRVNNLLYDTEYCFRFRAVTRYGVISGDWSGYTCARTLLPPGPPGAPAPPKVTGIQSTSGEGVVGSGTPFKLLVEWAKSQRADPNLGWYSVELWNGQNWYATRDRAHPLRFTGDDPHETVIELPQEGASGKRHAARVCAENIQHKACSPEGWYYAFAPSKTARADPRAARVLSGQDLSAKVSGGVTAQARATPEGSALAHVPATAGPAGSGAASAPGLTAADLDAIREKGVALASGDALAGELRQRMIDEAARRGFDAGLGIWAGNTAPGPGKQRVHDALPPAEQPGFDLAATFSLMRNKYAVAANAGASIAAADDAVAQTRAAEDDVFYWLGFDIASGIFGDPKAGAQGNTAMGPGAAGIRESLNAEARRGFTASMEFHLGRKYTPR
jgi:hypothetical protein